MVLLASTHNSAPHFLLLQAIIEAANAPTTMGGDRVLCASCTKQ
jgi:hypothetical protein